MMIQSQIDIENEKIMEKKEIIIQEKEGKEGEKEEREKDLILLIITIIVGLDQGPMKMKNKIIKELLNKIKLLNK